MGSCNCVNNSQTPIYEDMIVGRDQKLKGISKNNFRLNLFNKRLDQELLKVGDYIIY
jgi:hypothetical protein